ncbi:MAG TPA: bifunctional phosphopantothenoylcysteine decarboxylase/phosphopantothenate--cysteine ligase CoaBC [Pyrinomonadaceae bacterium]|nr:bifunctional phosphopantothenoylcysteine decarboxylase/phosphopantothenate--cysteine ligase CoaBC [Pyrinomonadaceae bacterium]
MKRQVALGVSGGIAAYKSIEVLRGLQRAGCDVRVAMTRHACEFIQPLTFRALSGAYVLVDDYAPDNPDPIAHITFSQTIDLFIIAPATANILAKMANGIADDFLTSTYLACNAPVLVAPAMNTTMWHHPATQRNIQNLKEAGVHVIEPDEGEMACGTIGPGRLSAPERIVEEALKILHEDTKEDLLRGSNKASDLNEERLLITTGATREAIDPVRFISNRSSGRMGFALAEAARRRGADVTIIAGATNVAPPADVAVIEVTSTEEMLAAVRERIGGATTFIAAAAVADYRAKNPADSKIKKSKDKMVLELERTPDILGDVSLSRTQDQLIIGFAAETNDLLNNAREKLTRKSLDMIVANDVSRNDSGFDSENNAVTILVRDNETPIEIPLTSKLDVANRILDEAIKLRKSLARRA